MIRISLVFWLDALLMHPPSRSGFCLTLSVESIDSFNHAFDLRHVVSEQVVGCLLTQTGISARAQSKDTLKRRSVEFQQLRGRAHGVGLATRRFASVERQHRAKQR